MRTAKLFIGRILERMGYRVRKIDADSIARWSRFLDPNDKTEKQISYRELEALLSQMHYFEDKRILLSSFTAYPGYLEIESRDAAQRLLPIFERYSLFETPASPPEAGNANLIPGELDKVHYACGNRILDGWLNIDNRQTTRGNVLNINLTRHHPFPDDTFAYGFAEDFLEHLSQRDSLVFLTECLRTFRPGGVLRLSFPGFENVLNKHYRSSGFCDYYIGGAEAYDVCGHVHFYTRGEIEVAARHVGFSQVRFLEYGESSCEILHGIDSRSGQQDLNTYVELVN